MIASYARIFLRNIARHPGHAISNLSSLVVGMTTCTLMLLFVRYEFNWNASNAKCERAYRVQQKVFLRDDVSIYTATGYPLAAELKKQVPEIEDAATIGDIGNEYLSSSDTTGYHENRGYYADGNIFRVLTFHFLQGDPSHALAGPFSVVLTHELAEKYFPGENAVGRLLEGSKNRLMKVTGVVEDLPFNVVPRPEYLVSLSTYREVTDRKGYDRIENIAAGFFETYVTLRPNASAKAVDDKIYDLQDRYLPGNFKKLYLKPVSEIHLTEDERNDVEIALFYTGAFALFVLLLGSINYISLSTASAHLRGREIGVRKAMGASRASLFSQFIAEALFLSLLGIVITFALVEILLPSFGAMVERPITLTWEGDGAFLLLMAGAFVVTGFLSGIYPALYLSGFEPIRVLKGNLSLFKASKDSSSKSFLRKFLVAFQFAVSANLLIGTLFVVNQVRYMKNKDLGFEKRGLLICRVYGGSGRGAMEALRSRLVSDPAVLDATVSANAPFHGSWGREISWQGAAPAEKVGIRFNEVDEHFIDTYRMKIVQGRGFSDAFVDQGTCIINETARKTFHWENPLGRKLDDGQLTVVGVVADFHPYSVHEKIPPYCMAMNSGELDGGGRFTIRFTPAEQARATAHVRQVFREFFPEAIIETVPFDNGVNFGTKGVWEIVERVFVVFAVVAVMIAANGLFGMISFAAQRKLKEIGVRKVFGASVSQMYLLMAREFAFILITAGLIAYPAGYLFAHTTPGAYKYQMVFGDYALAIAVLVATALSATGYHATRAVLANPVETLRYE